MPPLDTPKNDNPAQPGTPRALRTFEDDIASAMRSGQGSALGIVLAEQKRGEQVFEEIQQKKSSTWLLICGIALFCVSIIGAGYLAYLRYGTEAVANVSLGTADYIHPVIRADKVVRLPLQTLFPKNSRGLPVVYTVGGGNLSSQTVQVVVPITTGVGTSSLTTSPDLLRNLGTHVPALLSRSVGKDFALGVYAGDIAEGFLVLRINDFENAFSGMLEWEKFMPDDLFQLFGVTLPVAQPDTASSTGAATRDIQIFIDRTIKNKDVRVIQDETGRIYFMYGFVNRNTLIITTSSESYFEVAARLR